jgi:homoserine O-acetyltransferase/O-succinyltransferase
VTAPVGTAGPGVTPAGRHYVEIGPLRTESGFELPSVTLAYESWGTLAPDGANAVLVLHALTGDAHVVGPAGPDQPTAGWWPGLIGPDAPLDDRELFVLAVNVLGGCRGSTGPSSPAPDGRPWGSRFPQVTVRDQVRAEHELAQRLGITSFAAVIGGSMGGMRALEWGVMFPDMVRRVLAIATTAAASADQIAWAAPQIAAIRLDPDYRGGDYYGGPAPLRGMAIARQIAHATYRSADELAERFGRSPQDGEDPAAGGRYAVESYLQHHGRKLGDRFDPNSYVVLTRSMNGHDLGRGRGGVPAALARITAAITAVAVDSDRLYSLGEARQIAAAPTARPLVVLSSRFGHDGFLVEAPAIGAVVRDALHARP